MYLVPNIHPGSGSAGVPTVQANFAALLSDWTTVSTLSSMPSGGSISRSGQGMLYDSTGKLTYAPNNLFTNSQFPNGVSDAPTRGGNVSATTFSYFSGNTGLAINNNSSTLSYAYKGNYTTIIGVNYVLSVYIKMDDGNAPSFGSSDGTSVLNSFAIAIANSVANPLTYTVTSLGSGFYRVSGYFTAINASNNNGLVKYASNDTRSLTFSGIQLEAVTYQTTPSTYVATTTAAYYGPRFDYNPSTLAAKGLLIEGTRTNVCTYSNNITGADWAQAIAGTGSNPTRTSAYGSVLSPDGTYNANRVQLNKGSGTTTSDYAVVFNASFSVVSGTNYTVSFWVRSTDGSSTYTIAVRPLWLATSNLSVSVTGAWTRITLSGPATSTGTSQIQFGLFGGFTPTNSTTADIIIYGVQIEAGAFASSYIPNLTTGTTARAAETFAITGYSSNLINAYYTDLQTGVSSSLPYNAGTAPSPSFSWLTSLRTYTNAYAGSISSPSWLSFSRSGNALMTDSTGELTYAPANLLLNTATLSTQSVTTSAINYILSFQGTGSVTCSGTNTTTLAGTGASNRVSSVLTCTAGTLTLTVTGSVTSAQLEPVTYQTQPSLYIANTSSATYGPRYDFDPSTIPATPRGLLIEESRTNICLQSQNFSLSTSIAASTLTSNTVVSPDGTTTAQFVVPNTTSAQKYWYKTSTVSAVSYAFSVYAKAGGYTVARIADLTTGWGATFDLITGASSVVTSGFTASSNYVGNGWWRLCIVFTPSAGSLLPGSYIQSTSAFAGDGVSGVYFWGAQLEAGSFATSYIPTTTASVTRAADVAQLTGSALTTLQGSAATLTAEAVSQTTGNRPLIAVRNSSGGLYGNYYGLYALTSVLRVSSVDQANMTYNPAPTITSVFRSAFAFAANNFAAVANNGTVQTDTSGNIVTGVDQAYLGNYVDGTYLNGWTRSIALYNTRLPDTILKQKSSVGAPY